MTDKTAYQQKVQARLDAVSAEISKLKAKAEEAEADTKIEYRKQIDALRTQQREAEAQFNALRKAGEGAWRDMASGMENAWTSMERALENARRRFS